MRWALEIREPSWLHDDVFEVLRRHGAALCIHDLIADHPFELHDRLDLRALPRARRARASSTGACTDPTDWLRGYSAWSARGAGHRCVLLLQQRLPRARRHRRALVARAMPLSDRGSAAGMIAGLGTATSITGLG